MPDSPAPPPAPAPEADKPKRNRSAVNRAHASEFSLSRELSGVAAKAAYTSALAEEGIDAAFVTGLVDKISEAEALMDGAVGKTAAEESVTRKEEGLRKVLLEVIAKIQVRAKRKYKPGDPMRAKYFIGQAIESSRSSLETSTRAILKSLATDTLPGMKPRDVTALSDALDAYLNVQTEQTGGQSGATTDRDLLEAKVKEVAELRRQLQYAVDTIWPASKKTSAGGRAEFKLSPDRAMKQARALSRRSRAKREPRRNKPN